MQTQHHPRKLFLIACAKTKRSTRSPARDLYRSPLFLKSLAYAEQHADDVLILSAKHGLVELDAELDPYDLTIGNLDRAGRKRLAGVIDRGFCRYIDRTGVGPISTIVLAGDAYVRALMPTAIGWLGFRTPLAGLQIGERLAWLNERLRPYHVLLVRESADEDWRIEFGSFDKRDVVAEKADVAAAGVFRSMIITTSDGTQSAIDEAVAQIKRIEAKQ